MLQNRYLVWDFFSNDANRLFDYNVMRTWPWVKISTIRFNTVDLNGEFEVSNLFFFLLFEEFLWILNKKWMHFCCLITHHMTAFLLLYSSFQSQNSVDRKINFWCLSFYKWLKSWKLSYKIDLLWKMCVNNKFVIQWSFVNRHSWLNHEIR